MVRVWTLWGWQQTDAVDFTFACEVLKSSIGLCMLRGFKKNCKHKKLSIFSK